MMETKRRPLTAKHGIILSIILASLLLAGIAFVILRTPPAYDGKPGNKAGQKCMNPRDTAVMVWVPAGPFLMGSAETDPDAFPNEKPQHLVTLDGYWIYQNDVTVAQYKAYCAATGKEMPVAPAWDWKDTHPMVNVTWDEANAYAKWAGAHLPSEAQWEKAARGMDGRRYPWGNSWDAAKCNNFMLHRPTVMVMSRFQERLLKFLRIQSLRSVGTMPAGSYPAGASPYGCLDMAGNVWQWCEDWHGSDYYKISPAKNPKGLEDGQGRVVHGGSWVDSPAAFFRCARRLDYVPGLATSRLGFRCVVSSPGQ